VFNVEVNAMHVYHVGEAGILAHNLNARDACAKITDLRDKLKTGKLSDKAKAAAQKEIDDILDNFDWDKYLEKVLGVPKRGRPNDHAHHILKKRGTEAQRAIVQEGQDILREVGIDPYFGKEVLVWAKKGGGNHSEEVLVRLVEKLRAVRGNRTKILKVLEVAGQEAQKR
jgi:hypothetical protein